MPSSWLYVGVVTALVTVGTTGAPRLRISGEPHRVSCASATILIALAVLPTSWALISVAAGLAVAQTISGRRPAHQIAFNIAAHVLGVAAAAATVSRCGLGHQLAVREGIPHVAQIVALLIAAVAYAVVDELLTPTAIALASHTPWRVVISRDADIRSAVRVANVLIVCAAVTLLDRRLDLILAMPFAIATVYLAVSQRLRQRAEERTAQHLALATADIVSTDLTTVLHRAAHAALRLLSAAEADVEAQIGTSTRLVRVHHDVVVYDGPAMDAPPPVEAPTLVIGEDSGRATACLRLRFKSPTTLSDGEHEALRAFTFALNTALNDASGTPRTSWLPGERDYAATHDPLTGLGNRRYLEEEGARLMLEPGQHAVALLDLNRFKHVNDTLGHTAGDHLLVEIARRLAEGVTSADIVARLGGDEFTVIFANLPTAAHGIRRIEALLDAALAEPVDIHGIRITVEAATGIVTGPAPGGLAELLRRADVAMYQAKRQGSRICVYRPERDTAGHLTTTGQVVVTFQPVVDLATAHVTGAHALTSWQHPGRRRINPQRLALEHPTVLPAYSRHVLDLTLQAVAAWRAAGREMPTVVHVAARSLLEADFASDLHERLARTGVPADQLTIELSETLLHANFDAVNTTIRALANMGVRLGLTEFGTGNSSLAALAQIPVHQLTVAPQLVAQIDRPAIAAVTRSIVDLGRNLDLTVVADGVETEAQRVALRELGCTTGQGALFAEATSAERLLNLLHGDCDGRHPTCPRCAAMPLRTSPAPHDGAVAEPC